MSNDTVDEYAGHTRIYKGVLAMLGMGWCGTYPQYAGKDPQAGSVA